MSLPNTIIIPHGETESVLARWILSELRTPAVVHRPYGREERTVSMKGIADIMMCKPFDSTASLHKKYRQLDYDGNSKRLKDLTVAPILDVDADRRTLGQYRTGALFGDFMTKIGDVMPIYNDPNIEAVLEEAGCGTVAHSIKDFQKFLDSMDVDRFCEIVRPCDSTNMEVLIDHLKSHVPRYQGHT